MAKSQAPLELNRKRWVALIAATKRRRKRWVALIGAAMIVVLQASGMCHAQSPGGYSVAETVPFQPTFEGTGNGIGPQIGCDCSSGDAPPVIVQPLPAYPSTEWGVPVVVQPSPNVPYPDQIPPGVKKPWFPRSGHDGFFQGVKLTGTYLPRLGDESDAIGSSDLQLDVSFGLPFVTRETPLLVTPFYAVHFLDGPSTPDVPSRLNDAAVMFQHFRPLNDEWLVMLDLTIGEFADDESFGSTDALRITGGGAAVYRTSDEWKWVLGAEYVDRINTQVLPVAGVIYTPNDDAEYRLVFPAPKIAWRLPWSDAPGLDERWLYLGGEFGGGAWAVERASGASDKLDITDWRVFIGVERKIIGGLSRRVEVGYVFARKLEYSSDHQEVSLDDTLMLRAGLTY